ncbi:hypothetical protein FXB40_35200 [Bradyrhizobium rifense]|jgi:hypothetical protein|uniref:Uncharacterized protein n=1 Tax=Bradyrhizobium rifense TaxID=515499 RepID=A0A5D3K5N3_9BRAD|nr:hypothetical protein [Bradyrhizobium rifense]TYL89477.1 hypothetical protein FXB40_35200 [Bradyrhizobium rifense]
MLIKDHFPMLRALFRVARYMVDRAVASGLEVLAEDCERLSRSRLLIRLMSQPCGVMRREGAER